MTSLFLKWLAILLSGLLGGWLAGACLEWLLARVSYLELYTPDELTENMLLLALPLSGIAGALVTWNGDGFRWRVVSFRLLTLPPGSLGVGVLLAALAGLAAKLGMLNSASIHVAVPPTRVWFCNALVTGTSVSAAVGYVWILWAELALARRRGSIVPDSQPAGILPETSVAETGQ